jgi:hypothetical protein
MAKKKIDTERDYSKSMNSLYMAMINRLIGLCPPTLRVAVIFQSSERELVAISHCAVCAGALIHSAAEAIEDPRKNDMPFANINESFH